MKRKAAQKRAKKRRSAPVQGIPIEGGENQKTFFPSMFRPASEVRRDHERVVLAGNIPPDILAKLRTQAGEILAEFQRWKMNHSTKPHRYSWGRGVKNFYTVEESILHDLVEQIGTVAFRIAASRYQPEIAALVARLEKKIRLLEQRRENGQILAEEGRAALRAEADRRAEKVCRIYRRIRERHPPGRLGNGAALAEVSRQIGPLHDRNKPLTVQAIRNILKRRGVPCR